MAMIRVKNLLKEFKIYQHKKGLVGAAKNLFSARHKVLKAVDEISFEIEQGEFVGLLGPNGAGKSTTIKMLTGILVPSGGEIVVNGKVPHKERKSNAANIGVVFGQRTGLWWDLPPVDAFEILGKMYQVDENQFKQNMQFFIESLEMQNFMNTPVRKLSLGQKMRCEIAAALLHDPAVLFLDEPTIGLDIMAKEWIRKFLRHLNREKKTTILLTTHDLDDVEELCQRVMIIDHGKVILDGGLKEVKRKYAHYRTLNLDFNQVIEKVELPEGARVLNHSGKSWEIEFDTQIIRAPQLISELGDKYLIHDLSVQDVEIEEVIKRITYDI